MTAFLKFTQLIVGWVTPDWDIRAVYNTIAADNVLDRYSRHQQAAIRCSQSHVISRQNQPRSCIKWSSPDCPGGFHWSSTSSPSFLYWGSKTRHRISVAVQQAPSKGKQSLPLTPLWCSWKQSSRCCLPSLVPACTADSCLAWSPPQPLVLFNRAAPQAVSPQPPLLSCLCPWWSESWFY